MSEQQSSKKFHKIEPRRTFQIQALINAYHYPTKPAFESCLECYDFSQIIFVASGNGIYTTEKGTYSFSGGMMFYRPADHNSKYEWTSERASLDVISFVCPSAAMKALERAPFLLYEEEAATLTDLIKTAARIFEYVKFDQAEQGMRLRYDVPEAVLQFVCASLERFLSMVYCRLSGIDLLVDESQKASAYLDDSTLASRVRTFLNENLDAALRLNDISEHFGFSPSALERKFKKATGKGVMDDFTDQKIKQAKYLIRSRALSFTQIAEMLGFSTVNYFSKVFKARVGVSPSAYSRYVSKRKLTGGKQ